MVSISGALSRDLGTGGHKTGTANSQAANAHGNVELNS